MKVNGQFMYLGTETNHTKDGKPYTMLGLLQGIDAEKIYATDDVIRKFEGVNKMSMVNVQLDVKITSDRTYVSIVDVVPCK